MPTVILFVLAALAVWGTARLTRSATARGELRGARTGDATESADAAASAPVIAVTPQTAIGVVAALLIGGIWFGGSLGGILSPLRPVPTTVVQTPGLDTEWGDSVGLKEADYVTAERLIPKHDTIYVAQKPTTIEDKVVWTYSRLEPRVPVATLGEADWVIFVDGTAPTDPAYANLPLERITPLTSITLAHINGRP